MSQCEFVFVLPVWHLLHIFWMRTQNFLKSEKSYRFSTIPPIFSSRICAGCMVGLSIYHPLNDFPVLTFPCHCLILQYNLLMALVSLGPFHTSSNLLNSLSSTFINSKISIGLYFFSLLFHNLFNVMGIIKLFTI